MKNNINKLQIRSLMLQKLPVSPYFASVFMTLMSIVCGTTIGYLFTKISINDLIASKDYILMLKISNIFFVTIVIWHHVIVHNQFVAWRVGLSDSFVPFGSGLFLLSLVNVIYSKNIIPYIFFTLLVLGSFSAYAIGYLKLKKNHKVIINIYKNIFGEYFAKILFKLILKYDRKIILLFLFVCIYFLILLIAMYLYKEYFYYLSIIYLVSYQLGIFYIASMNFIKCIEKEIL